MLHIMRIIFVVAGKYTNYKAECSSHHAENTFLCMRLNPRGLTPSKTEMDDRQEDEKGQKACQNQNYEIRNPLIMHLIHMRLTCISTMNKEENSLADK